MDSVQSFIVRLFTVAFLLGSLLLAKPAYADWKFDADPPSVTIKIDCKDVDGNLVNSISSTNGSPSSGTCQSGSATLSLLLQSCSDTGAGASGCQSITYAIDATSFGPILASSLPYTHPTDIDVSFSPTHTISINPAFDNAGNKRIFTFSLSGSYFIDGKVFYDVNRNGAQEAGEGAVSPPITLTLSNSATATTNVSTGYYKFSNVPAGTYTLTFPGKPTYAYSLPVAAGTPPVDCSQNSTHPPGSSCVITGIVLPPNPSFMFGLVPTYKISGKVYQDDTGSACQGAGPFPLTSQPVNVNLKEITGKYFPPPPEWVAQIGASYSFPALADSPIFAGDITATYGYEVSMVSSARVVAQRINGGLWTTTSSNLYSPIVFGSGFVPPTPTPTGGAPTPTPTPVVASCIKTDPNEVFTIPDVPKPGYLSTITDPRFCTKVTRIGADPGTTFTALNGSGTWGSDVRHHYNDDQAWNADSSLIALQNLVGGSPSLVFVDGENYKPKYICSSYQVSDDRWHPSVAHKNERINVRGSSATLEWFDVTTCSQTRVWTLPFIANSDLAQNPSADGRFIAVWKGVSGASASGFVVDMDPQPPFAPYPSSRIGPVYDFFTGCGLTNCTVDHLSITPSGKYIVAVYEGDHPRVFDVAPTTLAISPHPMPAGSPECTSGGETPDATKGYLFDLGHDAVEENPYDGNEEVVIGQFRSWCPSIVNGVELGQTVMVRLKDNYVSTLTKPPNEAYAYHNSSMNYWGRPGWVYVSHWPVAGKRFHDEIIAVKLDGSQSVERLVHDHTDTTLCYRCEAHPVPSRDGKRVLFASSWTLNCGASCGSQSNPQAYVVDTSVVVPSPTPTPTPVAASPTPTPTTAPSGTITVLVSSGSDDAEENVSNGSMYLTSGDLEFTADGSTIQTIGMRFNNITIPKSSVITSAYVEFTARETQPDTTNLTFYGEAIDNSPTFTDTVASDVSGRTKTSASVAWSAIPVWSVEAKYQTPNLASIIQQIVNRSGWASGNSLSLIVTGTGHRTAYSYEGNPGKAPKLVVAYSAAPTPTPTPTITPTPTPAPSTITVYASTTDGRVAYNDTFGAGCTLTRWNIVHDATSGTTADSGDVVRNNFAGSGCIGNSPNTLIISRGFLYFNTSAIPDGATILSATLNLYAVDKRNHINDGNDFISVVQGLQGASLTFPDYSLAGNAITNPTEGSNRVDITNIVTNAYTSWTLNATGRSWISKTGTTKLAVREGHDILNSNPSYSDGQSNKLDVSMAEQAGAERPYLLITYQ